MSFPWPKVLGVFNHLIRSEPWAQKRLQAHAGACVQIDAGPLSFKLAIDADGLIGACQPETPSDVSLRLPPDALIKAVFEPDRLFSSVKLSGSADVAESLAFVLRNLRWDFEADLALVLGDIPAHRIARFVSDLLLQMQRSLQSIGENLSEYATEDSDFLPSVADVRAFNSEVDVLRNDLARLEKRIARF